MKRETSVTCLLVLPSVLVVLLLAFQWSIIDLVTPFLMEPIESVAWCLLFAATFLAVIRLFTGGRARSLKSYLPLLAFIVTLLCAQFVPFTDIWLGINFHLHRGAREKIAGDIFSGKLRPNVSYNQSVIALPSGSESLSAGGGKVIVEKFENSPGVYFFTYCGILGSSSGYLYMSSDVVPRGEDIVDIRLVAPRWFFVQTQ